ncbi:MAG: 30S ribosomal protein S20 [Desulfovibrionaceae bacterium]|nr:30S ribosomal protein S20 [Desulfovibrionaceae bacterium]
MANHKSALKRHRQSLVQAGRNRAARTKARNAVKAVRAAIAGSDKAAASEALSKAASVLAKAAGKGAIHRRQASRKVARLARAVNALSAAE